MFGFLKKLLGLFSRKKKDEAGPDEIVEEQWTADFASKPSRFRFSLVSETAYRAFIQKTGGNSALALELYKTSFIAWTEDPLYRYRDLTIRGRISLATQGYGAAGFMFRMVDERTCYMALVSNRGYFRLDALRNGMPLTLAGWTEAPGFERSASKPEVDFVEFDLEITAYGSGLLVLVNGEWAAELSDSSLSEGRVAFCAAAYRGGASTSDSPALRAALNAFSLDSRVEEAGRRCEQCAGEAPPANRTRLAETFTALGHAAPALVQLRRAWESRTAAAELRPSGELLLGAKLAMALNQWDEAEDCIEEGLRCGSLSGEFYSLKADFLYVRGRYDELTAFAAETSPESFGNLPALYNLLGHAAFNAGDYGEAAKAYDRAFEAGGEKDKNGLTAKNAANAWELAGGKKAALDRYIEAGRIFLAQNLYEELGLIVPKLRVLGYGDWEAHALAGKWAFGIENWTEAQRELDLAEKLRDKNPGAKPDPAVLYLKALLLIRNDRRAKALLLLEEAARLAPDYPLFRFRLAENRFLMNESSGASDPDVMTDLEAALKAGRDEGELYGWVHNFAAQLALSRGDTVQAAGHLENAASVLGEAPAVRVNRAVSFFINNRFDKALEILESTTEEDPQGLMANCAGNLLVRAGRFEEADPWYKKALAAAPDNRQYRCNRASCLIELACFGEADNVLTSFQGEPSPEMLELIAFVAVKKGEFRRAEAASRAALERNPDYAPSLLHLGWSHAAAGRWEEVQKMIERLDTLVLNGEMEQRKQELLAGMKDALTRPVCCASCGREWRVLRDPGPVPSVRLFAEPPDDMPAGTCPSCGKSFCVGCRKDALDKTGRFLCPGCAKPLKLNDEGLKKILYDWTEEWTNGQKKGRKKR